MPAHRVESVVRQIRFASYGDRALRSRRRFLAVARDLLGPTTAAEEAELLEWAGRLDLLGHGAGRRRVARLLPVITVAAVVLAAGLGYDAVRSRQRVDRDEGGSSAGTSVPVVAIDADTIGSALPGAVGSTITPSCSGTGCGIDGRVRIDFATSCNDGCRVEVSIGSGDSPLVRSGRLRDSGGRWVVEGEEPTDADQSVFECDGAGVPGSWVVVLEATAAQRVGGAARWTATAGRAALEVTTSAEVSCYPTRSSERFEITY